MSRPDLTTALAVLEQAAREAPPADVPGLVTQVAALLMIAGARLAVPVPVATNGGPVGDLVDDVHEVARVVRRSVSWVRKRGHTLPGFHQPGGKGTRVTWSRRALEAWTVGGAC
jgi:hypothetical protein